MLSKRLKQMLVKAINEEDSDKAVSIIETAVYRKEINENDENVKLLISILGALKIDKMSNERNKTLIETHKRLAIKIASEL